MNNENNISIKNLKTDRRNSIFASMLGIAVSLAGIAFISVLFGILNSASVISSSPSILPAMLASAAVTIGGIGGATGAIMKFTKSSKQMKELKNNEKENAKSKQFEIEDFVNENLIEVKEIPAVNKIVEPASKEIEIIEVQKTKSPNKDDQGMDDR